jgi:hypothetical protein
MNPMESGIGEAGDRLSSHRGKKAQRSTKIQGRFVSLFQLMAAMLGGCVPLLIPSSVRAGSCAPLQIQRAAGNVTLSWGSTGCVLQSASEATGLWSIVPGAVSPYTKPASILIREFFRVVSPDGTCSPNVVAYHNQVLASSPAGGLRHLVANPLNGPNNNLNTVLPLPDAYLGTFIERWDVASQSYVTNEFQGAAAGWIPNVSLAPGEAFFIHPVGPNPLVITWVGEVAEGILVNPLPPAGGRALRSSIVPQMAPIGDQSNPFTTLGFPAEDGDIVELFDSATQQFKEPYDYLLGFGWESFNLDDPGPLGPSIAAATGFFITKSPSATQRNWSRDFVVSGGCVNRTPPSVFESFAGPGYTNGASLAGLAGGVGFAGPWPSGGGVIRDGFSFGTFPSGGAAVHCDTGGGGFSTSRPLAPTVWPTAGQTFWMSYLILATQPGGGGGSAGCSVDGQFLVELDGGGNRALFLDLVPNDGTNGVHSDAVFPDGQVHLIVAKFSNYANGSPGAPQTGTAWGLTSAQYEALVNAGFTEVALDSNNTARITQSIDYPAAFTQGSLTLGGYSGTRTLADFDEIRIGLTPDSVLAPSPLLIAPADGVVRSGKPMALAAVGGQPPYTFSFVTNRSGGTLDPATGFYTAGPAVYVLDLVQVADTLGNTAVAALEVWPRGFMVTTTADSGPGSFRQGLLDANANLADGRISFNLPGAGPHKIAPLTPLPSPNSDVVIDGYTQPGSRPNTLAQGTDALLMIELSGENTTGSALDWFGSGSVTVSGLCINRWDLAIGAGCLACGVGVGYTPGVVIAGCFIGTDPTGTQPRPNGDGVFLSEAYGGRLGGPDLADRNLISGNTRLGVGLGDDTDSFTHNITIQNNLIGTDRTGTNALGNGGHGIGSFDAGGSGVYLTNFFIADNVLCANGGAGIRLTGENDSHRLVRNLIGVGADGLTPLGNGQEGIALSGNGNLLGGTNGTDGNVIAHNALAGVRLTSGRANAILGNRIFHNGGLAIDLGPIGVTANDAGDLDTGPNDLQNKPVLLAATPFETGVTVSGTLNSLPDATYRIEFFETPLCPRDEPPEAGRFLGATDVTTDANGNANVTAALPGVLGAGLMSATATDTNGNTSEVSTEVVFFVGTGFRPTLHLLGAGSPQRVLWPTNPPGFLLETNPDLGDPCGWQLVPHQPGVSGTNFFEDLSPLAPQLFFRLRRLGE